MKTEPKSLHATVREGYQVLLRADSDYLLPTEHPKIRSFYEHLTDTCLKWALEIAGERLRQEFLSLESVREKSQFGTQRYRLSVQTVWESETHVAWVCESRMTGRWKEPSDGYRKSAQVWCLEDETMLPPSEILQMLGVRLKKRMLPFIPHGIYPIGEEIVFFRNATDRNRFEERKILLGNLEK